MHDAGARKREWQPMESASGGDSSNNSSAHADGARRANGEVIEKEMKRLRLAHDYDASLSVWNRYNMATTDEPMDIESEPAAPARGHDDHNYSAKNNLLRECHYLRQLRKFQSERMHASFFERRGMDVSTQLLPPAPRY